MNTGRDLLPNDDGRSRWARLLKATLAQLIAHCGGVNVISDTRRMACRRIAAIEAELIFMEDRLASIRRKGKEPPTTLLQMYGMLTDRQRRLSEAIGWDRHLKDITPPSPSEYLKAAAERGYEVDARRDSKPPPRMRTTQ